MSNVLSHVLILAKSLKSKTSIGVSLKILLTTICRNSSGKVFDLQWDQIQLDVTVLLMDIFPRLIFNAKNKFSMFVKISPEHHFSLCTTDLQEMFILV